MGIQWATNHRAVYSTATGGGAGVVLTGTTPLNDGNWYQILVVSRSATDHELIVNGVSEATSNSNMGTFPSLTRLTIGGLNYNGSVLQKFIGDLDECYGWAADVSGYASQLYNSGNWVNYPFVPAAPVLSMTAGNGVLHLSWTTPANNGQALQGYRLYVGTSSGGEALKYDEVILEAGDNSFDDSVSISNGTTYFAYLTASNAFGESAHSNEVSATPSAGVTFFGGPQLILPRRKRLVIPYR